MTMAEFHVWAPNAKKVELALPDRRVPMSAGEGGWWHAEVSGAWPGTDYGFCLDGGGPLPDPCSCWQPAGVHGLSRCVGHGDFAWHDQSWRPPALDTGVLYELHVGTFSPEGTFDGVAAKLDHLCDLGVTHVELMPVNQFSGPRGWGYDGVDLYAPHASYGGPDGLKRLVDACHARGLAVLLDVVYNHFGPEGSYVARFGPYLTDRYHTPWGPAVNLDGPDSDPVRRFFVDSALQWLREYHADGLRIDSIQDLTDTSAVHLLEQLSGEVRLLGEQTGVKRVLIGESALNDPRVVRPPERGGWGLDAQWNDDFHHALHAAVTGERIGYYADFGSLADLAKALGEAFVYDGRYSKFRRRTFGRPVGDLPGSRFVVSLQNHDQVGNRAAGDRIAQLAGLQRAKVAASIVLTSPFVPLLFQGEEWAASSPFQFFTSFENPALGKAVHEGRQREFAAFGWKPQDVPDPQAPGTFERSRLNWQEIAHEPHASMLQWYKDLIRLRRSRPGLSAGGRPAPGEIAFDEEARWLVVHRGTLAVACNLADRPQAVPLGRDGAAILLASEPGVRVEEGRVVLPAISAAVVDLE
jgi:maltooligosyltrehalose trehalohydrolase